MDLSGQRALRLIKPDGEERVGSAYPGARSGPMVGGALSFPSVVRPQSRTQPRKAGHVRRGEPDPASDRQA
jgi:hypothetical protein